MKDIVTDLLAAATRGGTERLPNARRNRMKELFALRHPIRLQVPDFARTRENYRRTMLDYATAAEEFLAAARKVAVREEPMNNGR